MAISMAEIVQKSRSQLQTLTGLDISSSLEVSREGDEWLVVLEVVEKRSIPESMDILAKYETRLDAEGAMLEFRRTGMRKRIDVEEAV